MEMPRTLELLIKLRNGESVKCHKCNIGYIIPVGNYKTTRVFYCDKCDYSITLD